MTPARPLALIREEECIGCTKCIKACPVDAILGSSRSMHTVIADECIGCELCIAPCPVDCIELIYPETVDSEAERQKALGAKKRVQARKKRLKNSAVNQPLERPLSAIEAALARAKMGKKAG